MHETFSSRMINFCQHLILNIPTAFQVKNVNIYFDACMHLMWRHTPYDVFIKLYLLVRRIKQQCTLIIEQKLCCKHRASSEKFKNTNTKHIPVSQISSRGLNIFWS